MMSSRLNDLFSHDSVFNVPSLFDSDPFFQSPHIAAPSLHSNGDAAPANTPRDEARGKSTPTNSPRQLQQERPSTAVAQHRPRHDMMSPFGLLGGSSGSGLGVGYFDEFDRRLGAMDRMMNRMMSHADRDLQELSAAPDSRAYSCCSSKVSHTDVDGRTVTRENRSESRRVGDVCEEKSSWKDSDGNERTAMTRRLANQSRQIIRDRNAKGEQRQVEQLQHIQPEQAQHFDQQWEEARLKADPEHRLLSRPSDDGQAKLKATDQQARLASSADTANSKPAAAVKAAAPTSPPLSNGKKTGQAA